MWRPVSRCRGPMPWLSSSRPTSGIRRGRPHSTCSPGRALDGRGGKGEGRLLPVRSPEEETMHTVIRRYEGAGDSAEVARRAVEEFGPMLMDRPGFQGYYVVDAGDGVLATISVFDTEEAAIE